MLHVVKGVFILLIEVNIYFCMGYAMSKLKFLPDADTFCGKCIYGFLGYHVLFWCLAFPCTILNLPLTSLTIMWVIAICLVMIVVILRCDFKQLIKSYKEMLLTIFRYRVYVIPCLLLFGFVAYYVCINGQSDIDARQYIGEVTTRLDTNQLAGIDPVTGVVTDIVGWKYVFTMFGANSAVLCKIFQMRPLIFCRTVRVIINIFLLAITSFEAFLWIYREKKHRFEYAIMALMLSGACLFLFSNTYFTPSAFILHRTYEGKAYCSGALILLLIYLVIRLCEKNDKRFFLLIAMSMLVGMSISASAIFLMPVLAGCIILAYVLCSHRWGYIPGFLLAILLNIVYYVVYVSGFPGFQVR